MSELYDRFLAAGAVLTTDSRKAGDGSVFLALKGENFDGNDFAVKALEQGAAFAVVDASSAVGKAAARAGENCAAAQCDGDDGILGGFPHERFYVVDDTLVALQNLAREHRSHFNIPVIALTGTNGKTTTKELVTAVLSVRYNVLSTEGNLNNHIGVPLTLLRLRSSHDMAVIEMGASAPGEIRTLCSIALPTYGLITNVGKAHLQGFGSFEGVKKTKGELYDSLQRTADVAFVNVDNPDLLEMAAMRPDLRRVPYGWRYWGAEILPLNAREPFIRLSMPESPGLFDRAAVVRTHLAGIYNADNVAAAIAVGRYFRLSQEEVCRGLESYVPKNNRSQLEDTGRNRLLIDAYNANPSSMKAALDNFEAMDFMNKVLVLGDMRELGDESAAEHRTVVERLHGMQFSAAFLVGPEFGAFRDMEPRDSRIRFYDDVESLKAVLAAEPLKDAVILLKGSNGIHLPQLVEVL